MTTVTAQAEAFREDSALLVKHKAPTWGYLFSRLQDQEKISTCVQTLVHRLKSFSISGNLLSLVAEKRKGDGIFFNTSGGEKARALKS